MQLILKDLLLNIFFITFLPLLLVSAWGERLNRLKEKYKVLLANGTAVVSAMLCMTFPVHFDNGFIFDLRQIPVILACLYLGYRKSLPLVIVTLAYRFVLGGSGFFPYLLTQTAIFLIVPWFKQLYFQLAFPRKLLAVSALSVFFSVMALAMAKLLAADPIIFGNFTYLFISIHLCGMLLSVCILEYIGINMHLKDELVLSAKMQMIGEMSASVSHEIRNPLTVARGFMQLLENPSLEQEDRERYIKMAVEEIDRAKDIIDEYLILANPYPEDKEPVNLKEELIWLEDILQPYSNMHNVQIKTDAQNDLLFFCEKKKLRQMLMNLGKNAVEAMPGGGVLFIGLTEEANHAVICFEDNGIGMDENQIARLGEPYFTTKTKGTGLGMMVVWRIVQSMGGKIEVASKVDEGTDIRVLLPYLPQPGDE